MDRLVGFKVQAVLAEIRDLAVINIGLRQKIVQNRGFKFKPPEFSAFEVDIHTLLISTFNLAPVLFFYGNSPVRRTPAICFSLSPSAHDTFMKRPEIGPMNILNVEHRTSNVEHRTLNHARA